MSQQPPVSSRVPIKVVAADAESGEAISGASKTARLLSSAASVNATLVKAAPGHVWSIQGLNTAGATRWLKLYNLATVPNVGVDVPIKTLALPAMTGFALDWPGYSFSVGIGYALTTGGADNDAGALSSGDVVGLNIDYS